MSRSRFSIWVSQCRCSSSGSRLACWRSDWSRSKIVSFSSYDVDIVTYIVVQTIHVIHLYWFIFLYLGCVWTLNMFYCEILLFFSKKFEHISKQLKYLNKSKTKRIKNCKLSRLIYQFNRVVFELTEINQLFKVGPFRQTSTVFSYSCLPKCTLVIITCTGSPLEFF